MNLLIILGCVFFTVFLMVVLGERYGKPMSEEQQGKYGKIIPLLVFVMIIAAVIKSVF